MDLRRLEIFLKVVELGSFSRAAAATYLTQPTVSEDVKALEESLGLRLLDRLGREVVPTRAGLASPSSPGWPQKSGCNRWAGKQKSAMP